jgi:membrane fusion protein, heavy metal efflux system
MPNLPPTSAQSSRRYVVVILTCGLLVGNPVVVNAHAGHGNEFKGGAVQSSGSVEVDPATAQRLGFKVEPVKRERLAFGVKTTGQLETLPNRQVEVTTPVGGTVLRLLVKPGDRVNEGQAVAIMNSPDLTDLRTTAMDRKTDASASVQTATADLELAQENLARQETIVEQEVKEAQSAFDFAQESYTKDKKLAEAGAIPTRLALESGTKLAAAQATLAKVASRLPIAESEAQVKRAQSALDAAQTRVYLSGQSYETRLKQLGASANEDGTLTIVAPISGTVADRDTTTGESTKDPGKKIMSIVNGSSIQVSSNVFEKDLSQIKVDQAVRVKVNGLVDRTFSGRISVIGTAVNSETRAVPVKVELDNADGALKPGMFAAIEVLTEQTPVAVLAIPKSAIVETNDKKKVVFVQNGKSFQSTDVTLGRESGELIEVTNGLLDGDQVVTQRAPQLYAQSLRGGGHSPAASPSSSAAPVAPTVVSKLQSLLPIGAGLIGAIGLVGGTFWAGSVWGRRRDRLVRVSDKSIDADMMVAEPSLTRVSYEPIDVDAMASNGSRIEAILLSVEEAEEETLANRSSSH